MYHIGQQVMCINNSPNVHGEVKLKLYQVYTITGIIECCGHVAFELGKLSEGDYNSYCPFCKRTRPNIHPYYSKRFVPIEQYHFRGVIKNSLPLQLN